MEELWSAVDDYLTATVVRPPDDLDDVQRRADAAGLPAIQVSAAQGKLLQLLARLCGARRVLEIGTLAGYSTIWLARGVGRDGAVVTLELDPHHAEVARANVAACGLAEVVDIVVGPARESLESLVAQGVSPFDLVFIDADKASIPVYVELSLRLARPGTVIVVDNVVRAGAVVDADSEDPSVRGVRRLNDLLASHPALTATCIQTVGSKGYDGFTLALVDDRA